MTVVVVLGVVLAVLSAVSPSPSSPPLELSADTTLFDAGNIISDSMFFDPNALTYQQVASFIAAKGANCRPAADGTPCLKDYHQDTFTRAADGICPAPYYGGAQQDAADILWRVAQACNVSPKVLLVLLQKEQGLVTASTPTARKYQIATGYGCPDTSVCNAQYYGFYNQLYNAAHQYQRYAAYPTRYSYRAGVNNTIQWSPNAGCGTSVVFIKNQATAGLYDYTPYRPNAAALNAGYGTGNSCSAYGNRNFWLYFTDWFGSTQSPGGDAIMAAYAASGAAGGSLGSATIGIVCGLAAGGCGQWFEHGAIYWSPSTGAHLVTGGIEALWQSTGWETNFGYPTMDVLCGLKDGGCGQEFSNNVTVYSSAASGTHEVRGAIRAVFMAQGYENGALGYPTTGEICGLRNGGCGEWFQGGSIYWSPSTGAHEVTGGIQALWQSTGWESGPLAYPKADQTCGLAGGGCKQEFQGGSIAGSSTTGTHAVLGAIRSAWSLSGAESGPLGYPTADQTCGLADGGCTQKFQRATVYSSTAGAHPVSGAVLAAYQAAGGESGTLGYPATGQVCGLTDGGCGQVFQGGRIYTTPTTGAHAVTGAIQDAWIAQGWEKGPLGYPIGDQTCGLSGGGCKQDFQRGAISSLAGAGTYPVTAALSSAWVAAGGEDGALGYPTTGLICGLAQSGCGQVFQRGRIYTTPTTGAHGLTGAIQDAWIAQGWENGTLGYPTSDKICGLVKDGCGQVFQHGRIYVTTATGAHLVTGAIQDAWIAQGWENGALGYPTSNPYAVTGGTAQNFERGKLILNSSTGVVTRG